MYFVLSSVSQWYYWCGRYEVRESVWATYFECCTATFVSILPSSINPSCVLTLSRFVLIEGAQLARATVAWRLQGRAHQSTQGKTQKVYTCSRWEYLLSAVLRLVLSLQ